MPISLTVFRLPGWKLEATVSKSEDPLAWLHLASVSAEDPAHEDSVHFHGTPAELESLGESIAKQARDLRHQAGESSAAAYARETTAPGMGVTAAVRDYHETTAPPTVEPDNPF